jgi:dethiobiotin synthetase
MRYFITGIGTDVGKTLVAAVLTESLQADYWKPIQSGSLEFTDTMQVQSWVSNSKSQFHPERFQLTHAMSPHAAAELDGVDILLNDFKVPETNNNLIIEGAGGLMVPINYNDLIIDLIPQISDAVILVSQNYLGSINHTLLSIEALQQRNIPVKGIIFNGKPNLFTENVILMKTGITRLGSIPELNEIDKKVISKLATAFLNLKQEL